VKIIKRAALGVAFVAALAFVAGCQGSKSTPGGDGGTVTKDASQELIDAIKKTNETSYSFSMTLGSLGEMTGAVDPASKAVKAGVAIEQEGTGFSFDMIVLGTDMYMKMDLGGIAMPGMPAGKYMHLDGSKVTSLEKFGLKDLEDPTQAAELMKSLVTVEKTVDGAFKGTIDVTKLETLDEEIKDLGDKAKSIPFEATVDGEGRLTRMTMTLPAGDATPEMKIELKYFDFGEATKITKPADSEVVEAPAEVYQMIAS